MNSRSCGLLSALILFGTVIGVGCTSTVNAVDGAGGGGGDGATAACTGSGQSGTSVASGSTGVGVGGGSQASSTVTGTSVGSSATGTSVGSTGQGGSGQASSTGTGSSVGSTGSGAGCVGCAEWLELVSPDPLCSNNGPPSSLELADTLWACVCDGACAADCDDNACSGMTATADCQSCVINDCDNEYVDCLNDVL
jgi:hypothetical protein